jgi:sterol desaturase/sphingolipid hydroxylase (fatty acid hydroxylase superfamily)
MSLRQRLLAGARACGSVALAPFVHQPSGPLLPIAVYGSMSAGFVLWNLLADPPAPPWALVALPAAGLFLWTLVEYALHSRFFHDPPPPFRWVAVSHGNHHDEPNDPNKIVAHLSFSLPAAVLLYGSLSLVLWSPRWAGLVVVGLIAGYLAYEVIHFSIHRVAWARRLLRPLASHHLHHHYADSSRCFGVTSPLWDWVFRTGRRHRVIVTDIVEPEVSSRPGDAVIGG